ncbi:hypothetical protein Lesp01_85510 [Lentzea sp. NBRC 102530]|nr:hypothetical protein Lesp01_85510 [Lentzea sp. NBRC 102530]
MANGHLNFRTMNPDQADIRFEIGDARQMLQWHSRQVRQLRIDALGTLEAPQLRLEAQTDRPNYQYSYWAEFDYDSTINEQDGLPWGFTLTKGAIWSANVDPQPFTTLDEWADVVRHRESRFWARVNDKLEELFQHQPHLTIDTGLRFGGRDLLRDSLHDGHPRRNTIYVTDDSWTNAAEAIACMLCGDDVAPLDVDTGHPLDIDGDRSCLQCWTDWRARQAYAAEAGIEPEATWHIPKQDLPTVTPPRTVPRFLLLHAGANAPAWVEAVEFDPAKPFRAAACGIYNFAAQTWTCSHPVDEPDKLTACGATTPAANPAEWTRCSSCCNWLILV